MIDKVKFIPITDDSHPLTRAYDKCDFETNDYVEEEYFIYGTSNIYKNIDNMPVIDYKDAPYINRILVRRPNEAKKASGRVFIEILNATSGMDIDRMWVLTKNQLMRNGDIYVGITSKPSSVEALKKFDYSRYKELSWKNPIKKKMPSALVEGSLFIGALNEESEAGLFWDMLEDISNYIRESKLPLGGIKTKKIYLTGWSQSTGYMLRYLNSFVYINGKKSAYDGYLAGGSVRKFIPGMNQYENNDMAGSPDSYLKKATEPFISVQTESENYSLGNEIVREDDSDTSDLMLRIYDIPGSTHDNKYNMIDYYEGDDDKFRAGIILSYLGEEPYPNNYPYEFAFNAACKHMYSWAENGIIPPKFERIKVAYGGKNVRDKFNNAVGGWRLPPIDVPVCTYYPFSKSITPNSNGFSLFGFRKPFSKYELIKIYKTFDDYKTLVVKNMESAVKAGRLLQEDMDDCIDFCLQEVQNYGLKK